MISRLDYGCVEDVTWRLSGVETVEFVVSLDLRHQILGCESRDVPAVVLFCRVEAVK